jgi:hypothetical protein
LPVVAEQMTQAALLTAFDVPLDPGQKPLLPPR